MKYIVLSITLIALSLTAAQAQAQEGPVNSKKNIANYGYDVVSYWTGKPVKGTDQHTHSHRGVKYYFSSVENQEKFKLSPEKFVPEFGGFCAYAMAKSGDKVPVNPQTYEIRDQRLLLFYNRAINNTLNKWKEEGPEKLLEQVDENWKGILTRE